MEELQQRKDIILIDVRNPEEFISGHIPQSINIPLDKIGSINEDKERCLFVYCQSGMRSKMACKKLSTMGYKNVTNIGGIHTWMGSIERGK